MIWLIRHGESIANAGGVTADYVTMPLTERGHTQARHVAAAFPGPPDRIVLSPYHRARQTAEPLRACYPDVPVEEQPVQEFTYLDSARCAYLDGVERQPLVAEYWARMDPTYRHGPGAESFAELLARVDGFLNRAAGRPGWTVVFTHAQFIRTVLQRVLFGAAPVVELMRQAHGLRETFPVPNACIVRLRHAENRWWAGAIEVNHLLTETAKLSEPASGSAT